ncbi:MAG: late competence development ComFB family protein [Rectinemataceae bacterium]|jgi:competence protein ComFB
MKLHERYNLESLGNRSQELVYEAVEDRVNEGAMCTCEDCVIDLTAWTLNHVTPCYYSSLLSRLIPDAVLEHKMNVEIDLAIASGLKRLKEHPHHG